MADTKPRDEAEAEAEEHHSKHSNQPRWWYHIEHGAKLCEDGQRPQGPGWKDSPAGFKKKDG